MLYFSNANFCSLKQSVPHDSTYISTPPNPVTWKHRCEKRPTCLEIFQGRVTAPRSQPVISMDLSMTCKLVSSYLFGCTKWKWLGRRNVFILHKGRHLRTSLCPSSVQLNSPDRTHSKNLVLRLTMEQHRQGCRRCEKAKSYTQRRFSSHKQSLWVFLLHVGVYPIIFNNV